MLSGASWAAVVATQLVGRCSGSHQAGCRVMLGRARCRQTPFLNRELVSIIDGMNKSKSRPPRLGEMSKALYGHWRPTLHFHGRLPPPPL